MIADEREKSRSFANQMKLALVGHDPQTYLPLLFGDALTPSTKAPAQQVEPDFDPARDDTTGEWRFEDQMNPADAEAIMAELLADTRGSLTSADVAGEWQ